MHIEVSHYNRKLECIIYKQCSALQIQGSDIIRIFGKQDKESVQQTSLGV